MYSSTFSIADIGKAPSIPRPSQRSLHGSQSHANLHYGGESPMGLSGGQPGTSQLGGSIGGQGGVGGGGFGGSVSQQQAHQYMPGYLLAASQGQPAPAPVREFTLPQIDNEGSLQNKPSVYGRGFGEESLLSAPRPSPKGRSPRTPVALDDDNAPPTMSISESQWNINDSQAPKLAKRHSTGGFHPLSRSNAQWTPSSSLSTTYESNTPGRAGQESGDDGEGRFSVTIFGFGPLDRQQAIECFLNGDAEVPDDGNGMDVDGGRNARNWAEIIYKYEQDAIRAVKRSGSVVLQGGNVIIGAKWTDPSLEMAFTTDIPQSRKLTLQPPPVSPSPGMQNSRSVKLKPSASAFRSNTITAANPTPSSGVDEFGIGARGRELEAGRPQQESMLGRVSSIMFGGWA